MYTGKTIMSAEAPIPTSGAEIVRGAFGLTEVIRMEGIRLIDGRHELIRHAETLLQLWGEPAVVNVMHIEFQEGGRAEVKYKPTPTSQIELTFPGDSTDGPFKVLLRRNVDEPSEPDVFEGFDLKLSRGAANDTRDVITATIRRFSGSWNSHPDDDRVLDECKKLLELIEHEKFKSEETPENPI